MENNNNSTSNDSIINEVEDISIQSDENSSQINEIRDQISEIKDQNIERNIEAIQAEDDQIQLLTESLTESNDYLASIDSGVDLNNHLVTGQFFFTGILVGVVLFRILFDRLRV